MYFIVDLLEELIMAETHGERGIRQLGARRPGAAAACASRATPSR
jgi:hypothetical protein